MNDSKELQMCEHGVDLMYVCDDCTRKYIQAKNIKSTKLRVGVELVGDGYFKRGFRMFQENVHKNAVDRGWHDDTVDPGDKRTLLLEDGTSLALIHAVVSEALVALRRGNLPSEHIPEFSGVEEEIADIVIRCMDMSAKRGYRLAEAIVAKHAFNKNRPYRHENKLI